MELKYLRLIKTIVEEGSIVNSSEKLFLTQSALSHQLIVLEERLGFKVFYRSRNRWELTIEGEELYKVANEVLESIEGGFNRIRGIKEGSKGTIKISTECYSFYQGLPGFIEKMGVLYPEISVDLILEATHQPISKLLSHEIDLAIVSERPNTEALSVTQLFDDEIFAVMHGENRLSSKEFLDANDFRNISLLIHSFPLETVSIYNLLLKPNHINPADIIAVPLTEVSLELANANMGIMCMPKWALNVFKLPDNLVFKKIGKSGLKRTHYLVVRLQDRNKKYINDFVRNFQERFSSI